VSSHSKNRGVAREPSNKPPKVGRQGLIASAQAERDMLIGILETLSHSRHINEYLEQLVEKVRNYSGCCCVGIRLLDDEGNIPYVSYTGFSREFYESESALSIKSDKCMCINVIKQNTDPELPFYTKGGSFLSNSTTKLLASVPEETKGRTRNVCNEHGYESVALVPMRHKEKILGLIHVADESKDKIPIERVRFLERIGAYIGEALHTVMAEKVIEESERHYRDLYDEAPNAYFSIGADGCIRQANRSAVGLLGCSLDELIGRPVLDLYADTPNGKPKAEGVLQRSRAGKEIRGEELEMCRADGSNVWISLSVRPIYDREGRVVLSRSEAVDITDRKLAEERIRYQKELLEGTLESLPHPFYVVNANDHTIEIANSAARLGKPIGNQKCYTMTHGNSKPCSGLEHPCPLEEVKNTGKPATVEHIHYNEYGTTTNVEVHGYPIFDKEGNVTRMITYSIDITERKKLDQLKDDFIGLVSHELRSPLTVIIGAVNTVLTEGDRLSPEETRQLITDAALEADALSHLLSNLLELSRAQANRLLIRAEPVNVARIIQDTVEEIKRQSSAHQFILDIPKKLPTVYVDRLRLERILYNLIDNAVKYSPQGGEVRVSVKSEEERLVIAVSDQGIGISRSDQAKLFGPFQRLEELRLNGIRGLGLGLLVCRRLVEAHDGRIWVESDPGKGSTFFFTLPLSYSQPGEKHPGIQTESKQQQSH